MQPPAPRPPAVHRLLITPARAGAMAAGGSLLGLAAALWIEGGSVSSIMQMACWLGCTLVSIGVAIRFGYPGNEGGLRVAFERALGAVLFGVPIVVAVVAPVAVYLPRRSDQMIAGVVVSGVAVVLILLARLTMPSPPFPEAIPDGPGGLLPAPSREDAAATYALAPTGPALTADEAEGADLAVEIRVLWGGELLAVRHLSPPRPFHVGDAACDFVIDGEPLGTARFPLVVVEGSAVSVVAPRGASGMILGGDPSQRTTLEHALAEGLAEPFPEVPSATKITLALGTRVTLSLPSGAAATAYRAAPTAEDATHARIVLEVALVRAGRVVGRRPSLGDRGRLLASTAAAASVILGGLSWLDAHPLLPDPDDDDGISADARYLIQQHMVRIQERIEELEPPVVELGVMAEGDRRTTGERTWGRGRYREDLWTPEHDLAGRPFASLAEMEMFGPHVLCWNLDWDGGRPEPPSPFGSALETLCKYRQVTPFGLRMLGPPSSPDLLGRDPDDLWLLQYADAKRRLVLAPTPDMPPTRPVIEIEPRGEVPAPIMAALHRRTREMLACYELGLAEDRFLQGDVDLALSLGVDGVARAWKNDIATDAAPYGTALPDSRVVQCLAGALAGPWRGPPPARVVHAKVRVHLALQPGLIRRPRL